MTLIKVCLMTLFGTWLVAFAIWSWQQWLFVSMRDADYFQRAVIFGITYIIFKLGVMTRRVP